MESKDIFIIIFVIVAVGFSIYRRYVKKNRQETASSSKPTGSSFPAGPKEDDYEPYSGK